MEALRSYWDAKTKGQKLSVLNGNVDSFEKYIGTTHRIVGVYDVLDTLSKVTEMVNNELDRRAELAADGS